ncbi:M20 family metallopeptidase [Pararhizobium sp. YC-54]|uniref:M20 metallopeptidase family protein n=1 Tax=Pararhizobium sp. YC-54 TaxID=2986920 RepID=UPI0021F6D808|nr:M20 family metallopeptidase [Pararhizobium sp. YC-54]MCW0001881.1 M20 family metallopeptidase [Pararhizobium sp. YC-54]
MRDNQILSATEAAAVLELRHAMHRRPELSNQETATQQLILSILDRFGLRETKTFHKTGVYVDIVGNAEGKGKVVAVRGDIDALPIHEERDDLPFRSEVPGLMHACGHDVHASVALGTALAFHRLRDNFAGRLRVFFHPAEEAEPVGGRSVRQEALLDGIDHSVGFHVTPDLPTGTYAARPGAATKSADQFTVTFTGTSSHGAMPYRGVDAISVAAAFINEVQKLVSREVSTEDGSVVSIGTIRGGEAANIICPLVVMEGTIRTKRTETRAMLCRRVREIAEGIAVLHRASAVCHLTEGEPPVINDADMAARFQSLVRDTLGAESLHEGLPAEGSDDFGYYSETTPSLYFWFGTGENGKRSGLHTPTFAVSDSVVVPTTELAVRYCFDLISR